MNRGLVATAEVLINAPASRVWVALTDPDIIQRYMFGAEVISEWKEGGPIVWKGTWQGKPFEDKGVILKLEPGSLIQYSHYSPLSGVPDVPENYHTVTIQLSARRTQTLVSLSQDQNSSEQERDHSQKNWQAMLEGLKRLLEDDPSPT